MRRVTPWQVEELLVEARLDGLVEAIVAGVEQLQGQVAASGKALNAKHQVTRRKRYPELATSSIQQLAQRPTRPVQRLTQRPTPRRRPSGDG